MRAPTPVAHPPPVTTPTTPAATAAPPSGPLPVMLEFFRLDRSDVIVPTLTIAIALTMIGSLLVAAGFVVHRYGTSFEHLLTTIGILSTAAGPTIVILRLRRVLTDESYVALRTDGVALHKGTVETLVRWEELTEVHFDEARKAVVLERGDQGEVLVTERFAGIDHAALAKRIDDLRRKASFNLLPKA